MSARLHYDVHGLDDRPVLVLSPSLGTTPDVWEPQTAAFAERFRVVRVGHRGHDPVDVPLGPYAIADLGGDVLALLDSLGIGRFSYCGLSLGGMVGMWVASHAPERVVRLALCSTSARLPPAEMWLDRAAAVRKDGMAAVAETALGRWFTPEYATTNPQVVQSCRDMLLGIPPEGYAGCCAAIAGMDLRPDLHRITAPTLVLAATEDPSTPPPHAETIASLVAGARLEVVDGLAHFATVQAPETTTPLLLEHLGGDE